MLISHYMKKLLIWDFENKLPGKKVLYNPIELSLKPNFTVVKNNEMSTIQVFRKGEIIRTITFELNMGNKTNTCKFIHLEVKDTFYSLKKLEDKIIRSFTSMHTETLIKEDLLVDFKIKIVKPSLWNKIPNNIPLLFNKKHFTVSREFYVKTLVNFS